jgi:hypothetical protein|tara:strand:+ start:4484 stop:4756 length:273 start_codon:yes stop_codon:yes gene_type:complete
MSEVKRRPGRPKKKEVSEEPPKGPKFEHRLGPIIKFRDQRQYMVLESYEKGWLVAELKDNFGKMGEVFFWRSEFIEEIQKRNYIVPSNEN